MGLKEFMTKIITFADEEKFEGDLTLDNLGDYLLLNKNVLGDRNKLQSILKDIMPHETLKRNLLMMGYNDNILSLLDKGNECEKLNMFENQLKNNYGIDEQNAKWIIITWLTVIFKKKVTPQYMGSSPMSNNNVNTNLSTNKNSVITNNVPNSSNSNNNNYKTLSMAELNEVLQSTWADFIQNNCWKNNKIGVWDIMDRRNCEDFFYTSGHYIEVPNDTKKRLILKKLCRGSYNESDLLYVRTTYDINCGWALTKDSFCIGEVIPYESIEKVFTSDSSANRRSSTLVLRGYGNYSCDDTLNIQCKNGKVYKINEDMLLNTANDDTVNMLHNFLKLVIELL
ncbi:hypothetical protein [Selenomonas ruminantium]|uniref:hypothetical protein n=1 Tax=Selenomonas ruminantium TaxID=971 RepID=UPI000417D348|nr:hypothetical protein [Selenomonas ruminantium]